MWSASAEEFEELYRDQLREPTITNGHKACADPPSADEE
jgi:hypothetical protein